MNIYESYQRIVYGQLEHNPLVVLAYVQHMTIFLFSKTFQAVMNIYESYQRIVYGQLEHEPLWGRLVIKLSHFLLGISSAVNILIYSYKVIIITIIIIQKLSTVEAKFCNQKYV